MTVANHNIVTEAPPAVAQCIEVRWSCTVTKWTDRFGLFTNGQRHGKVEFVVAMTRDGADESSCTIAAWLVMGDRRRVVLAAEHATCAALHEGSLTHVDVTARGSARRLLALSFHGDQLVFAQSPLLHQAGFTGGSYDPPHITATASQCAAARA